MKLPILSVVIPCYNQGAFIQEALDSLPILDNNYFEVIIINDGSTEIFTNDYLRKLESEGYKVVWQANKGLGEARNTGIKIARGKYILPLDADNKIRECYFEGIEILEKNDSIAVVYGNRIFFGDKSGIEIVGEFNLQKLMLGNFIDACAIIRKSVIEEVGYYSPMKIMGCEDWDLWLRIAFKGYKFYYLNLVAFDYRVLNKSMLRTLNADIAKQNAIELYFVEKYNDKLDFELLQEVFIYKLKKKPWQFIWRALVKKLSPKYYQHLIDTNKIYRGFLYNK